MLTQAVIAHVYKIFFLPLQPKSFSNVIEPNEEIVYLCTDDYAFYERFCSWKGKS